MGIIGRAVIPDKIALGHLERLHIRPYIHDAGIGGWPGIDLRRKVTSALNRSLKDIYTNSEYLATKDPWTIVTVGWLDRQTPKTDVLLIVPGDGNNRETYTWTTTDGRLGEANPCQDALEVFATESEHQRRATRTPWQWSANPPGLDACLLAEGFLDNIPGAELQMPNGRGK